jgi:hypothetical protein
LVPNAGIYTVWYEVELAVGNARGCATLSHRLGDAQQRIDQYPVRRGIAKRIVDAATDHASPDAKARDGRPDSAHRPRIIEMEDVGLESAEEAPGARKRQWRRGGREVTSRELVRCEPVSQRRIGGRQHGQLVAVVA